LAIEIDGAYHDFTSERDAQRQRTLEAMGIRFIRVLADDVERRREAVADHISAEIARLGTLTPGPSPTTRERGGQVTTTTTQTSGTQINTSQTDCPSPSGRGVRGEGP
jgi:hypothetical protein